MRRRDREIKEHEEIVEILKQGSVCHLAMCKDQMPYVIPMLYVYDDNCVYFHCAEVGQKLDIIRENNNVCFEVQVNGTEIIKNGGMPCDWGYAFQSVIGFGKAEIINEEATKIKVYDLMVEKMRPADYVPTEGQYVPKKIKYSFIIKVEIDSISGKKWDGHK
ncbi:MAG: pyridoxamine 5'-phosphate oxidase family protein [Anaerovorax sp.]